MVRPVPGLLVRPQPQGNATLTEADQLGFMRRQVLTSGNIRGSRFVDLLPGGLNDRSPPVPEHAPLQPAPRPAPGPGVLRQRDLPYAEASLFGSYAEASATPRRRRPCGQYRQPLTSIAAAPWRAL
jgi:hypothetical protein